MSAAKLTRTQREALIAARDHGDARLRSTTGRGGAGHRMLNELTERGLLSAAGNNWRVGFFGPFTLTDAGRAAIACRGAA